MIVLIVQTALKDWQKTIIGLRHLPKILRQKGKNARKMVILWTRNNTVFHKIQECQYCQFYISFTITN